MSEKKNNSQGADEKKTDGRAPAQVAPPDKHLGATSDEDIPQDDLNQGGKGKAGEEQKAGHGCEPCKDNK